MVMPEWADFMKVPQIAQGRCRLELEVPRLNELWDVHHGGVPVGVSHHDRSGEMS